MRGQYQSAGQFVASLAFEMRDVVVWDVRPVCAAGLAAPARAQDGGDSLLNRILDRGTVIVGTGSTNPPWHFEDENGQLVGMDIEMARILARAPFEDTEKVEFLSQAADARQVQVRARSVVHARLRGGDQAGRTDLE